MGVSKFIWKEYYATKRQNSGNWTEIICIVTRYKNFCLRFIDKFVFLALTIVLLFLLKILRFGEWILSGCLGKTLLSLAQSIQLIHIQMMDTTQKKHNNWIKQLITNLIE